MDETGAGLGSGLELGLGLGLMGGTRGTNVVMFAGCTPTNTGNCFVVLRERPVALVTLARALIAARSAAAYSVKLTGLRAGDGGVAG